MTKIRKKDRVSETGELQDGLVWFERTGFVVTLGLTNLGLDHVGEIDSVELPTPGLSVEEDEMILSIDGNYGTLEVKSPSDGSLIEVNSNLEQDPRIINEDPLESGWLVRIKVGEI